MLYILGQKLSIKGKASVEQAKELTKYIDGRIKEVTDKYPNIPVNKVLILTLFNVAEELHALKNETDNITKDISDETTRLLAELFD